MSEIVYLDDYRTREPESIGIGVSNGNIILYGDKTQIVITFTQALWLAERLKERASE